MKIFHKGQDISRFIGKITWSGSRIQAGRKLVFEYLKTLRSIELFITLHSCLFNIDSLTTEAEDVSFARKLIKVTQASPVLTEVDKPTLISFIKQYSDGMLLNQLKFNETEDAIILGSKKSKKTLLKVLNDDYLESKLTSHLYSSATKDDVTPTIEV